MLALPKYGCLFGWQPNFLAYAKILVASLFSVPTPGQICGGEFHRQLFGSPAIWCGWPGRHPDSPSILLAVVMLSAVCLNFATNRADELAK